MAVVIVQSRATAHVYRIFGALMALLLLMALAVGVVRVRADRAQASPYGALAPLPSAAASPVLTTSTTIAPPIAQVIAPAATPPVAVTLASTDPVSATPAPSTEALHSPREIAIDKAAAGSAVPQPAPPAVVEAATRAAAAVPAPRPVSEAALEPVENGPAPASDQANAAGRININTASVDQLNSIPGGGHIGRSIARHRPYRSLEDLVDHRVLKARDFARIKSAITID